MEPLREEFNSLINNSLAKNTWNVYENALKSFAEFRNQYSLDQIWPPPLMHIINYVIFLSSEGYSATTAKSYISGISFKIKLYNGVDSTKSFVIQKLLSGMSKKHKKPDLRRPITLSILERLVTVLTKVCDSKFEQLLFSSIFSLAFFGFLRIGEIADSSCSDHIIQIDDVQLDKNKDSVTLIIQSSKTDQYGNKQVLEINKNANGIVCPVKHLIAYLNIRPKILGPLFCHFNQKTVTRYQISAVLKFALSFNGYNPDNYNTHSFRIGAATTAALMGKTDDEIKLMGRWKSDTFRRYIRIKLMLD